MPPWLPILILFPLGWLVAAFLVSRTGWSSLARHYRLTGTFDGDRRRYRSCSFGLLANYNRIVTFGTNAEGLCLVIPPPFNLFHPPLFFPWAEITARREKRWSFEMVFTFEKAPGVELLLKSREANEIAADANRYLDTRSGTNITSDAPDPTDPQP